MKFVLGLALMASLSACSLSDLFVKSDFKTPSASGNFSGLDTVFLSDVDTNQFGGYAYALGDTGGSGFRAYAGLLPGTAVAPPPTTGVATMTGRYQLSQITGINVGFTEISGFPSNASGSITLTADFGNRTLTGGSSGAQLLVDGTFEGSDLSGRVIYNGEDASLDGVVGATTAIGVFHDKTDTSLMAGGFIVN